MTQTSSEPHRQTLAPLLEQRGVIGRDAMWTVLSGGRTNRLWKVSDGNQAVSVKLFAETPQNPLFPNDPECEARLLNHLAPHDIAPLLLDRFETELGHCVIYAHVPGQKWDRDVRVVAQLLHRLHQIAPPNGLRETPNGSAELRRQGGDILSRCAANPAIDHLRSLTPEIAVPPTRERRLLHADPVPANIICDAGNCRLIDWQCPATGDPCEDLAIFLSPAMQLTYRGHVLSAAETGAFLASYPNTDITARYRALAPWYHWRMAAYCLWQTHQGDPQAQAAFEQECAALTASRTVLAQG